MELSRATAAPAQITSSGPDFNSRASGSLSLGNSAKHGASMKQKEAGGPDHKQILALNFVEVVLADR